MSPPALSVRIRAFLERAKNFLIGQTIDALFDFVRPWLWLFFVPLVSTIPWLFSVVKDVYWPAAPDQPSALWPLSYYFMFTLLFLYPKVALHCNKLKITDIKKCGFAYLLHPWLNVYLRQVEKQFDLVLHDEISFSGEIFPIATRETLIQYDKRLLASYIELKNIDGDFFERQFEEKENLIGFMCNFEAQVDKLYTKCEQQQHGYVGNFEADLQEDLRNLFILCNEQGTKTEEK